MKRTALNFALTALATSAACFGAIPGAFVCPQAGGAAVSSTYTAAVATTGTCNEVITVTSSGGVVSASIAVANPNPFDGSDDNLVGIVNNSGIPLTVVRLSSANAIFALETPNGDGICAFTPFVTTTVPSQSCNAAAPGASNYAGTATSYTNINGAQTMGDVNFAGIPSGPGAVVGVNTGYFSLEAPPAAGAVTVVLPVLVSKSFSPSSIVAPGTSTVTITITNPNSAAAAGIALSDTFPAGVVGNAGGAATTCGGTVAVSAGSISVSGVGLAPGTSCTITVPVSVGSAGTFTNVTTPVTATGLPTGGNATAILVASVPAPGFSKSFSPATVAPGGTTTLTFTVTNMDGVAVTGLAFTDTLPAGLAFASPSGLASTCGGVAVAATGPPAVVSLSDGSIAAPLGTTCTVSVSVVGVTEGVKVNTTSTLTSANAPPMSPATATLTVISPATISKSFGEVSIVPNGTVRLSFNITNPNTTLGLTGVGVTDTLPAGLLVNNPSNAVTTCTSGTVTAVPGTNTVTLAGGTLAAATSCTVTVFVQAGANELGLLTNTSGPVLSSGGPGGTATATVFVGNDFQVNYIPNLNLGDSVVNITNSGALGAGLNSGTTAATTGAFCANVYTFTPDEQLASCCSCPVTPNGLVSLSAKSDLVNNTLTPAVPTSIVVKLLATVPVGGSCTNSAAAVDRLALSPGLIAFGTKVHATGTVAGGGADGGGGAGTAVTETRFRSADLSAGELSRIANLCNFILANGSGFGICRSCRLGGLGANGQ